jgi:hypothetical protein
MKSGLMKTVQRGLGPTWECHSWHVPSLLLGCGSGLQADLKAERESAQDAAGRYEARIGGVG